MGLFSAILAFALALMAVYGMFVRQVEKDVQLTAQTVSIAYDDMDSIFDLSRYATEGLRITLKYDYNDKPIIQQLRRVSKPGLRRYVAAGDIPRVRGGIGTAVLSTSRGVMSDREARAAHVGGEVLCHVW